MYKFIVINRGKGFLLQQNNDIVFKSFGFIDFN
jgi:hypothetical protein